MDFAQAAADDRGQQAESGHRPAEIAVIIVNYGTAPLAIDAVDSVLEHRASQRGIEVHLVDNASPGDDATELAEASNARGWGGAVSIHFENTNHGFGRGNNLVLRKLAARENPPDKVFLLNPDAKVENGTLEALSAFLDEHPLCGCVGAAVVRPDTGPVSAAFRFPSSGSEFSTGANVGLLNRAFGISGIALDPGQPTRRVDWVTGAAVMFRFDAICSVGFFDEEFFLYFEEVDLMRRMAESGWQIWHCAEARVQHIEGAATKVRTGGGRPPRRPRYWYDSYRMYFLKAGNRRMALRCAMARYCGAMINSILAGVRLRSPSAPREFYGDFRRFVLAPLITGRP